MSAQTTPDPSGHLEELLEMVLQVSGPVIAHHASTSVAMCGLTMSVLVSSLSRLHSPGTCGN